MKKFTKNMLILAAFLFVTGLAITASAEALGGEMPGMAVLNNGWHGGDWFHDSHMIEIEAEELPDIDAVIDGAGVEKLEISVEAAGVEIMEGDGKGSIYLAEAGKYIEWEQEIDDDTLKLTIRKKRGKGNGISSWDSEAYGAVLVLPGGEEFHEMKITVGAGNVNADRITANKLELEAGAGSISIDSGSVGELKIDSQAGSVIFTGRVERELEADCQAGSAEVYLAGSQEDFDYDLDVSIGNIEIDGRNYSGLDKKKAITNEDAWKKAKLNCEIGSVELVFYEE